MTDDTDALWNSIIGMFRRLPDDPEKHYDCKDCDQDIRDAHFYATIFAQSCEERHRRNLTDADFIPLPWYRFRVACARALVATKGRIVSEWRHPVAYSVEHIRQVWQWLDKAIHTEYAEQYSQFYHKLKFWNPGSLG